MATLNYRQIPDALRHRRPFTGHTMSATTEYHGSGNYPTHTPWAEANPVPRDARYYVYSYSTPIAWVTAEGEVVVPDCRYSVTTARQQNLCRAWL